MKKNYDFSIESITGERINFKDYKINYFIVNTASYCDFENNMIIAGIKGFI